METRPDPSPYRTIGMLVRERRTVHGLTQRELAQAAGISIGVLRDIEQDRSLSPRWVTVESLAATLGFDSRQYAELMRARRSEARAAGPGVVPGEGGPVRPVRSRIGVLGPAAAWHDDTPVPLGPMRQRAVLGLLALYHGVALDRDTIIDQLWGTGPPPTAVTQLQGYVSSLRRLLGFECGNGGRRGLIVTVGSGYLLEAADGQLDAAAFTRLAGQARAAADEARLQDACSLYEQALELWRGEVLADIDLLHDHPAAAELAHRRSEAVVRFADVAVRADLTHRPLPYLRELCVRECFNEQAHAFLILTLAAAGQQAAALEAFASLRDRLDRELGVRPGPQLTRAHAQVLRQQYVPDPELRSAPDERGER